MSSSTSSITPPLKPWQLANNNNKINNNRTLPGIKNNFNHLNNNNNINNQMNNLISNSLGHKLNDDNNSLNSSNSNVGNSNTNATNNNISTTNTNTNSNTSSTLNSNTSNSSSTSLVPSTLSTDLMTSNNIRYPTYAQQPLQNQYGYGSYGMNGMNPMMNNYNGYNNMNMNMMGPYGKPDGFANNIMQSIDQNVGAFSRISNLMHMNLSSLQMSFSSIIQLLSNVTYLKNEFFQAFSSYSLLKLGHWIYVRFRRIIHWVLGRRAEMFGLSEAWESNAQTDHTWSWLSLFFTGMAVIYILNKIWSIMHDNTNDNSSQHLENVWNPQSSQVDPNSPNQILPINNQFNLPYSPMRPGYNMPGAYSSAYNSPYGSSYGSSYGGYGSTGYGLGYGSTGYGNTYGSNNYNSYGNSSYGNGYGSGYGGGSLYGN